MNKRIFYPLILLLFFNNNSFSQSKIPFYEQLAFNFYKDSILKVFPVKGKITISKSLIYSTDIEINYFPSGCLKKPLQKEGKKIGNLEYSKYWKSFEDIRISLDLTNIDKKQFKIRKLGHGTYPKLFVYYPKAYQDRIFVIVHEKYEFSGKCYLIEFNQAGEIIDWCQSKYESIIVS